MSAITSLLLLVAATTAVLGEIPRGYILDVSAKCGRSVSQFSSLNIKSDLVVSASALCVNGKRQFTSNDGVNYALTATYRRRYSGRGNVCVLSRKNRNNIYTVDVRVAIGEKGREVQNEERVYTLTCVYDRVAKQKSRAFTIKRGLIPSPVLRSDVGRKTTSTIALNILNVRGQRLTGSIPRGIKVYLSATTNGRNREAGLRPVSCDAIGTTTGARLPILISGCVTNSFFGKFIEFTTRGRTVTSPYFEMVQIEGNPAIRFECTFTLCATNCNGGSCRHSRKKRSSDEFDEVSTTEDLVLE